MLKISDNATHCAVTKILTYLLTGGKKAKSYKQLHHWLDAESRTQGPAHRRGLKHNILISPFVAAIITRDPTAGIITAVHICQDSVSSSLKRSRRKYLKKWK